MIPFVLVVALIAVAIHGGETEPKPRRSYATAFAADSIFLIETPDAARLKQRYAQGPLARTWRAAELQTWWERHKASQLKDGERRAFEAAGRISEALDGSAVFAIGPPELIEALAEAPPAAVAAQAAHAGGQLVQSVRALRDRIAGEGMVIQRSGPSPYKLEETPGSTLAYRDGEFILGFQPKVFQSAFKGIHVEMEDSLLPALAPVQAAWPEADLYLYLAGRGLKELGQAGFILEEEHAQLFAQAGFAEGSALAGAIQLNEHGFHERYRLRLASAKKDDGPSLLALLTEAPRVAGRPAEVMGEKPPPQALDALPSQASVWISLRADTAKKGAELSAALRKVSPGLAERLDSARKFGKLDAAEALAQVSGPLETGLFFLRLESGQELPLRPPIEFVVSAMLREAGPIRAALDEAARTIEAFLDREDRGGGAYFYVKDDPRKGGWWIGAERLLLVSSSHTLDLALAALEHRMGAERLTDRPDVRNALDSGALDLRKTLTIFADATQALELPYAVLQDVSRVDTPENPWPAFGALRASLGRALIQFGPPSEPLPANEKTPNDERAEAELTVDGPLPLLAWVQVFRMAFEEAGW